MIYAVIDTNVLVSAQITKNQQSPTVEVLERMLDGGITPVYNEAILAEYIEVLHRPKFHLPDQGIDLLIDYIRENGIHADRIPYDGAMPDEKDRPFYEVSLSYGVSFLVTGNIKHFPVTLKVVTPAQIISIMDREREVNF